MHAPDPIVSASIFCDRGLDQVVHGVVAPVLAGLRAEDHKAAWSGWWVRYARNGDHLKVRFHGAPEGAAEVRRRLGEAVHALFGALPVAAPAVARLSRKGTPPLDSEDEVQDDYPDRSLLWTDYRRSHISLGPKVLLRDDVYVAHLTRCLSSGAELVLESTALDEGGRIRGAARQRAVLRALVSALGVAGFSAEHREEYLAYHRDWLLRFTVADEPAEERARAGYDRQVEAVPSTVEQLARTARARWNATAAPGRDDAEARWAGAVTELCTWAEGLRGQGYSLDPYTTEPAFPLVFKALHGVANQAGLDMLNEAFVHHLVLRATQSTHGGAPARAIDAEAYV